MIARSTLPWPSGSWKTRLAEGVADVAELLALLGLPPETAGEATAVAVAAGQFPVRVPRGFVARMQPGDPHDPLLRQVLADAHEHDVVPGWGTDPVGELGGERSALLQKYRGRALLVVTGACAVHCRYCFRRHFPYGERTLAGPERRRALASIAADDTVREVILSGGDPLAVSDDRLAALVRELEDVPHVKRLRIHTRLPVVLPERVDDALLDWLSATRLQRVVVLHVNHAREIDHGVRAAVQALRGVGATVLNQAVLLAGVNDTVAALVALSEALAAAGVLPYYLHMLDRVAGATHFEVPEDVAGRLVAELRQHLPGYLVPRLVRELPGAPAKVPVPDPPQE